MEPAHVLITGAAGQIGYILSHWIASGALYGDRPVVLHLLEIKPALNRLEALCMELQDCAFPTLAGVIGTTEYEPAFSGIDCAFLVASVPLRQGEVRADLLKKNASIFKATGEALGRYAKRTVKVLTIGNPCNTNALVAMLHASGLSEKNFHSLSMLDYNRAVHMLASKFGVEVGDIRDMVVWGNHAESMVADLSHAYFVKDGKKQMVKELVSEDYAKGEFFTTIAGRAWAIMERRGFTSAASPSKASLQHMKAWLFGTEEGEVLSMGIPVPESCPYGIKPGVLFSFPCTVDKDGEVHVKEDFPIDSWLAEKLKDTDEDLRHEREVALQVLAAQQ